MTKEITFCLQKDTLDKWSFGENMIICNIFLNDKSSNERLNTYLMNTIFISDSSCEKINFNGVYMLFKCLFSDFYIPFEQMIYKKNSRLIVKDIYV